jgi:hypothetical protein
MLIIAGSPLPQTPALLFCALADVSTPGILVAVGGRQDHQVPGPGLGHGALSGAFHALQLIAGRARSPAGGAAAEQPTTTGRVHQPTPALSAWTSAQ